MPIRETIPPVWLRATSEVKPIESLSKLPTYGAVFFLRSMGGFRMPFFLLTLVSFSSELLSFGIVYLISELIDQVQNISASTLMQYYVPVFIALVTLREGLDYFVRKYGEAFSTIYSDHLTLRFYLSILKLRFAALVNLAPQRLLSLLSRYVSNVRYFTDDWFWGTSRQITNLGITIVILYLQSPVILAVNVVYFSLFLCVALRISAKFSPLADAYSREDLHASTIVGSFAYNLSTVRRLGIETFFSNSYQSAIAGKWAKFSAVREFHARRWLLQLILYQVGYIGTLCFGAYQVKQGKLPLGFLVLIKYAFDTLSRVMIHIIEYYVALVQQRADGIIVREEFKALEREAKGEEPLALGNWNELVLKQARYELKPSNLNDRSIVITVPKLVIPRGAKIGVIGPSGIGKTSLLNMLLNLLPFEGDYFLNGTSIRGREISSRDVSVINNTDPLFAIPLRDNLLLGRELDEAGLQDLLQIVGASEFTDNLDARVGQADFNLSSGQQQRIRIARGIIGQAQIYLLDEPFNGIDEAMKTAIIARLKTFFRDKTVILITHHAKELELIDTVYTLRNGELQPAA